MSATKLYLRLCLVAIVVMLAAHKSRLAMGQKMADVIAIKEGADLDLSCPIVVPNEDMIITWTCNNEPANIKSSRIHVTDSGKLRIRSAKVGDSCNYRCEAANGFGTLSVIIKVIIVDKKLMDKLGPSSRHHQNQNQKDNSNQTTSLLASTKTNTMQVATKSHHVETFPLQQQMPLSTLRGTIGGEGTYAHGGGDDATSKQEGGGGREGEDGNPLKDSKSNDDNSDDLQIHVEPQQLEVGMNKTFSLECRVKHASGLPAPQIIWLKEFIGRKPESLAEAHEQNLIAIDNVYYHSLNWPRSFSYSERSACANSALLVRHSTFVHSGRYICFAGYPPAIMASNLTLDGGGGSRGHGENIKDESPLRNSPLEPNEIPTAKAKHQPLRYKMVLAVVKVDDPEGERRRRLLLESAPYYTDGGSLSSSSLLIRSGDGTTENNGISDGKHVHYYTSEPNSWPVTTMVALLITCGLLLSIKLIYVRFGGCAKIVGPRRLGEAAGNPQQQVPHASSTCCGNSTERQQQQQQQLEAGRNLGCCQCIQVDHQSAIKQIDSSNVNNITTSTNPPRSSSSAMISAGVATNTTSTNGSSPSPFMANLGNFLHSATMTTSYGKNIESLEQQDVIEKLYSSTIVGGDEHLYSEIGERRTLDHGVSSVSMAGYQTYQVDHLHREATTNASAFENNSCDLYTIPNRRSMQPTA